MIKNNYQWEWDSEEKKWRTKKTLNTDRYADSDVNLEKKFG